MAPLRPTRARLRLGLGALFAVSLFGAGWARAEGAAERAAVRKRLDAGEWVRRPGRWVPAKDGPARAMRQQMGSLRVGQRGRAVVVRTYVPETREGVPGYRVEHAVAAARGAAPAEPSIQASIAFDVLVGTLGWSHLHEVPLAGMYGRAMAEIVGARPTDRSDVYARAMRGAASQIDRWTGHLSAEEWRASTDAGPRVGLGIALKAPARGAGVVIDRAFPGSPAARAGLRAGDRLVKVGDTPVADVAHLERLLRGAGEAPLALTIARRAGPVVIQVARAAYPRPPILRSSLAREGVAVIRLGEFAEGAGTQVLAALRALSARQAARGSPLKGLVLDLRGNGGGSVEESVRLARAFVAEGRLVTLKDRAGREVGGFDADRAQLESAHLPLAVLVDHRSASASELLAGALANGRATLMGSRTFGKGVQQAFLELPDGSALRYTDAQFFTPDASPHGVGITPTVGLAEASQAARARSGGARVVDPLLRDAIARLAAR